VARARADAHALLRHPGLSMRKRRYAQTTLALCALVDQLAVERNSLNDILTEVLDGRRQDRNPPDRRAANP
jgi:transcriptional accessory protein Tex/SPT6